MWASLGLGVFLSLLLWFEWDRLTGAVSDREILQFFEEHSGG